LRTGLVLAEVADATAQPHPDIAVLETIALGYDPQPGRRTRYARARTLRRHRHAAPL
jgi:hypothetical protein